MRITAINAHTSIITRAHAVLVASLVELVALLADDGNFANFQITQNLKIRVDVNADRVAVFI